MGACLSRDRPTADDDDTTLFPIDDDVELVPLCRNYGRTTTSTIIVCSGLVENSADLLARAETDPQLEGGDFWLAHVHHAVFCTDDKELVRAALWGLSRWHRKHKRISRYPF